MKYHLLTLDLIKASRSVIPLNNDADNLPSLISSRNCWIVGAATIIEEEDDDNVVCEEDDNSEHSSIESVEVEDLSSDVLLRDLQVMLPDLGASVVP